MTFPAALRTKLHSTNPLERVNGEIKRRTDVVGIFPNDQKGDSVFLDNLSSQKGTPVRAAIRVAGARLSSDIRN